MSLHSLIDVRQWAGDDQSLASYMSLLDSIMAKVGSPDFKPPEKAAWVPTAEEPTQLPRLLTIQDGTAVISIRGPLVNSASWINEYFGMTGYPEIREAAVHALNDASVNSIVLDIGSGGGMVSGCSDTGELLANIDKLKPVFSFTDSNMCSAAYWLGCSGRSITATASSELGSIGVLAVQTERTGMLEQMGIKAKVFRSGKYKALGHPMEKLSELGEQTIQASVDYSGSLFTEYVAQQRGVTADVADKKMGQGRVFPASQALEVGLIDKLGTFDDVMLKASKVKPKEKVNPGIAFPKAQAQNAGNSSLGSHMSKKSALTAEQIAQIQAGAATPELMAQAQALIAENLSAVLDAGAGAAAPQAQANGTAAAVPAAPAKPETVEKSALEVVKDQLAVSQEAVLNLTMANRDLTAEVGRIKATSGPMRAVVEASVTRLKTIFKENTDGVAAMSDTDLLAAQNSLSEKFGKEFKTGGVAAVASPKAEKEGAEADSDSLRQARISASRTTSK